MLLATNDQLVLPVPTGDSSAGSYLRCSCILAGVATATTSATSATTLLAIVSLLGMARQAIPRTRASGGPLVSMFFFFHIGTIKLN